MSSKLPVLRVAELTRYLQDLIEQDPFLFKVKVEGELSNYQRYPSGHHYFDLKERVSGQEYLLSCVLFAQKAGKIRQAFKDGMLVTASGRLRVYPARGRYQLYVEDLEEQGRGELFQKFLELKAKLEAEGLFAPERKKPIPLYPRAVGVVTSPKGAALRDILATLKQRHPKIRVYLSPAQVQGEESPESLIRALNLLLKAKEVDTVILARGGGSFEDLQGFNDENLARFIAEYPLPLISGVGHETDFTIADFVSDLRAATPTASAQVSVPELSALTRSIANLLRELENQIQWKFQKTAQELDMLGERLKRQAPEKVLAWQKQTIAEQGNRLEREIKSRLEKSRLNLHRITGRLEAFSPLAVLKRGYSITRRLGNPEPLKDSGQASGEELLETILHQGRIISQVKRIIS